MLQQGVQNSLPELSSSFSSKGVFQPNTMLSIDYPCIAVISWKVQITLFISDFTLDVGIIIECNNNRVWEECISRGKKFGNDSIFI